MNDDHQLLELRDYLDVVRRRRGLVGAVVVAMVLAAAIASTFATSTYQSSVELLVQTPPGDGVIARIVYGDADIRTQHRLVTSLDVAERAAGDLGIPSGAGTLQDLLDHVSVELVPDTSMMVISAEHAAPEMAAAIPLAFAESYISYRQDLARARIGSARQQLEQRLEDLGTELVELDPGGDPRPSLQPGGEGGADGLASERELLLAQLAAVEGELTELALVEEFAIGGRVISPVALPGRASAASILLRNLALGTVLGGTLGIVLAFAREWGDDRIVREKDIEAITGRPVIGRVIPSNGRERTSAYPSGSPAADNYRALKAALRVAIASARDTEVGCGGRSGLPIPAILVTDADGRSYGAEVAANLATAFARSGTRTLLVDGRQEPGSRTYVADSVVAEGLSDMIVRGLPARGVIQGTGEGYLHVMAPGRYDPRIRDELTARRLSEALQPVSEEFDLVIIDAGPGATDGTVVEMSTSATVTVLVAALQRSTRQSLEDTMQRLRQVGSQVIGSVVVEPVLRKALGGHSDTTETVPRPEEFPGRG